MADNVLKIKDGILDRCLNKGVASIVIPEGVVEIGRSAFNRCTSLASVVIPESVTEIGGSAFYGCTSLSSVEIPAGVTVISESAFRGCSSLSSVVIPEGVTKIDEYAFYGCSSLSSVVIPAGVTEIGENAFSYCSSLSSVVIPESVTEIGHQAFNGCKSLSSVVIPAGVKEIGERAFQNCASLASVEFGGTKAQWDAVKGKDRLFRYVPATSVKCADGEWQKPVLLVEDGVAVKCLDKSATSVEIPAGVTEIGDWAFYGCTSLSSMEIPDGVEKIGGSAFCDCTSLSSVAIPESVTEIGGSAFYGCTSLSSVAIPEGVVKIEQETFSGCTSLSSVVIPESVTKIGGSAFQNCASLESVSIPEGVVKIEQETFSGCTSLSSVVLPNGVSEIGTRAFQNCASFESVSIPEGVVKIGESAFEGCASLRLLSLPSTLKEVGKAAFKGCDKVESITSASPLFPFNEKTRKLYDATGKTKKVILVANAAKEEAKQEKIEKVQLASADSVLDSIVQEHPVKNLQLRKEAKECFVAIPAKDGGVELCLANSKVAQWMQTLPVLLDKAAGNAPAKELREYAQANSLPDASRKHISISKNGLVTSKDSEAVYLVIPEGVTEIGEEAFYGSFSLRSVVIPKGVAKIGESAFGVGGCDSLSSVEYGGTIEQWESVEGKENLFSGVPAKTVMCADGDWLRPDVFVEDGVAVKCLNKDATNISIPSGVTEIGDEAFGWCKSLSSVVIPKGVAKIGKRAFCSCDSLSSVEYGGTVKQWECVKGKFTLMFGSPLKAVRCADGEWERPVVWVEDGVAVKCLDKDASSVTIPSGVTKIGENAFANCKSLLSVVIPDGVSIIDKDAFENCTSLSEIVLPEGVRTIGFVAFSNCTSLSEIVLPESVSIIDYFAFKDCTSLSKITFGGTMEQWAAVQKGEYSGWGWHPGVPATVVHCSDGDADLDKAQNP